MTDKEAIEYLKTRLSLLHRNYQFATEQAIETVLNLIQTQQEEIERLECNNEILQGELDRIGIKALKLEAGSSTDDVIAEIEKKDKIIDEMIRYMYRNAVGRKAFSCDFRQKDECIENGCEYCINKYFINKVEKENKDDN